MKVTLIARTELAREVREEDGLYLHLPIITRWMQTDPTANAGESLSEFAGRACYQSFDKPNEKTRANKDYLANILRQQHESVLEHGSASFYVQGVSRNLLLELERHRHLSFSVISQRFVDSSETGFILPPAVKEAMIDAPEEWRYVLHDVRAAYESMVSRLEDAGFQRKPAREAARAILPGGIETKFVVTGNHRAWRDVLKKRYSVHADAEIRELATEILSQLRRIAPAIYQDFPTEPFGD